MKKLLFLIAPLFLFAGCGTGDVTVISEANGNTTSTSEILREQNAIPVSTGETKRTAAPKPAVVDVQVFPMSQVTPHNSLEDCWTVIEGKVYDLTSFAKNMKEEQML